MRALVIAPEPFFTPRGTPLSVYHRTAAAAEIGLEIDLLTYGQGRDVDLPGVRIIRIPALRILGEVPAGPSFTKAFLDLFLLGWAIALLLRHRHPVVHAHEEAVFLCLILKPIFGFKLVYDMHSSLPQQLENFRFTRSRVLIGLFDVLERLALQRADAVITICPVLAEYVGAQGVEPERHFLIENSLLDPVRLTGVGGKEAVAPVPEPPEGVPLIVYAGTLEAYQGIDLLLEAAARLRERDASFFLLILGGTPQQVAHQRARAEGLGVADRCAIVGRVSQETARSWIERARVQVSPRISGTNTPLKVYEQLASRIPLVATNIHAHTQVLDDSVALLVDPDAEALAEGLSGALSGSELCERIAARARERYEAQYSREQYHGKLRALLAGLA